MSNAAVDLSDKGKYKDDNGHVLHGVHLRESKKIINKFFINNGHLLAEYKYPKIEQKFSSSFVNDYNLHLCGGWSFPGVKQTECLTRVIEGKKLMGFYRVDEKNKEEKCFWLEYCENSGLPYIAKPITPPWGNYCEFGIAARGILENLIDIESLKHDYQEYAKACKHSANTIVQFIDSIKSKEVSDFLNMDYGNPENEIELFSVGLLLGYSIETTVSLIWRDIWT